MIGTRLMDRYELVGELGRGGMGVVYRATDPLLGREVAVKLISKGDSSELFEERFRREAQLVANLEHPSIVPIFDFGRHDDALFFVMPVLDGTTLFTHLRERTLHLGEILEIVAQVAEALDYAASQGVVHRDVKPENVMVARSEGGAPRVWVMDFGLALGAASRRLTHSGNLPGTLSYLSPEYVLALDLDGRSDLYSLGTILYECLVGEPPFVGSQGSVLYRIVHEPPPSLEGGGVDPELDRLVRSCLAKSPDERPQRGRELAAELRRYREALAGSEQLRRTMPAIDVHNLPQRRRASPLVGRSEELAVLLEKLSAAVAGECQLVLVGGEAGIGKTRLLEELELMARARAIRVLRGRFSGHEGTFPHHGFCELVQDYFRGRGDGRSTSAEKPELGDLAAELVELFPALGAIPEIRQGTERAPSDPPSVERSPGLIGDQTRIFELLARTLIRLSGDGPIVFLLESLHLGETSIEALQYVVRRLGPTPSLVVCSYRSSEVGRRHPLTLLMRDFKGDPRFASLVLGPLAADEHRELVAALTGGGQRSGDPRALAELASRLYEVSEGNPFFTRELVRSLVESGDVPGDDRSPWSLSGEVVVATDRLPETIQQAVEARVERLPEERLQLLSAASVLGRSFDFRDFAALVGDSERAEEAVDQLIREGLLEEDRRARGDQLGFTSAMVRDVLHAGLTRRRRRQLHRRHAEQLEKRHAGRLERVYPQLVHHFSQGDVALKTVTYALMLARMSAGAFSPMDTIRATRTALEFVEDYELDQSGEVEGELRLLLASALRISGNPQGALREAGKATSALEQAGELAAAAAAALVTAEIAWQLRKVEDNGRALARGIELARSVGARGKLRELLTFAATVSNLRGEHQRARAFLEEVERLDAEGKPQVGEPDVPPGGTLTTALPNPITTTDPAAAVSLEDAEVLGTVFEPLLGSDAEGNPIPRLATSWVVAGDGGGLRLRLRPELRFADGEPLTAADVKRSFERAARWADELPAALRAIRGIDELVLGAADDLLGLIVEDELTLRFELGDPLPIFPALLTDLRTSIVRERGAERIGTGPFRLLAAGDRRVVIERNPHWRGASPPLERIELRVLADATAIAAGLHAGELDVGRDLSPFDLEEVLRDPELRTGLVEAPKRNIYFALWNLTGPAARRREVRRALSGVVRTQDLVWRTLGRFAQPASCLIPPGILGHDAGRRRPALSREEARGLLEEAGVALPLRLRAAVHPLFQARYATLLEALLEEWSELGLEVEVVTSSMDSYLARWRDAEEIDLLIVRWVPDYDDPDNVTHATFHSRRGAFRKYVALPELDRLLERARHESRPASRQALYRKVEDLLAREAAVLPLFHDIDYRIAGPQVVGLRHVHGPPYVNYAELGKRERGAGAAERRISLPGSGTVRVPVATRFDRLEPSLALFVETAEVVPNVFETLTCVEEGARIAPFLAADFRVEEGGRRVLFELRSDVRFHDGRRLGARDVRYSFERLLRSPYPGVESALLPIRGARAFHAGETEEIAGVRIRSDRELTIELEEPISFFPAMLTNPMTAIVPEGTADFDGNWRQGCAGTGPFRLVRFDPGERVDLEANPHYWRRQVPRCRRLVFELGVPPERMAAELRSGRYALAAGLRAEEVEELRRERSFAAGLREAPGFATYFLLLNSRSGPFADPELRAVFRRALGAETVVASTLGGLALPAHGLIPAGILGHEPPPEREPDAEPAEAGDALSSLELRAAVHPLYLGQLSRLWEGLEQACSGLGVVVRRVAHRVEEVLERVREGRVDLVAARRIAAYPDADAFVSLLHSESGLLGNLVGNPEVDRLIEKGRTETDPALRHVIYRELEQLLDRETHLIPLFDGQIYCFARPEIEGVRLRLGWPKIAYEELRRRD